MEARRSPAPAPAPVTAGLAPVLVVEDDPVSALAVEGLLLAVGLANPRVHLADGDEAIQQLRSQLDRAEPPALVLLDTHVPGRSGLEVLVWMRRQEALARTPVVMLTAEAGVAAIGLAYSLGVAGYLVKPLGYDALSDVLRGLPRPWALL